MSDSLEKFVLQYHVEVQDAIKRLEQLNDKIEQNSNKSSKAESSLKKFAKGGADELSKLVPGIDKVIGLADKMKGGFIGATVALAGLAYVLKEVNNVSKQFELNRITGFNTGNTALGVDQIVRRMGASNGRMDQAASRSLLEKVGGMTQSAYLDPNPWNKSAIQLRNAGTSGYNTNGSIKSPEQALQEMANKFSRVSDVQAKAIGQSIGLTLDEIKTLQSYNSERAKAADLTQSQLARQEEANVAADKYVTAQRNISRTFDQVGTTIGQEFMPIISQFLQLIDEGTRSLPEKLDTALNAFHKFDNQFAAVMEVIQDPTKVWNPDEYTKAIAGADTKTAAQQKAQAEAAQKQKDAANTQYATGQQMAKNINLFAASVGVMAGVVDESQAWAAWAGSVGAAGGAQGLGSGVAGVAAASGGGSGRAIGGYGTSPAPSKYDAEIERVWGQYADIGKAIMAVESSGNPNAKNPNSSASGLMQVLKGSWKPGENPFDPNTSIAQGYRVFMQKMKRTGGDIHQAIKIYGENTEEYVDKVYGKMPSGVSRDLPVSNGLHAESRSTTQRNMVLQTVAETIGIPVNQLSRGQIPKGDIEWALRQMAVPANNAYQNALARSNSPMMRPQDAAQAAIDLRNAKMNLDNLKTYGNSISGVPGGRQYTVGRPDVGTAMGAGAMVNMPITIYASDPQEMVNKVKGPFKEAIQEAANYHNTSVSH